MTTRIMHMAARITQLGARIRQLNARLRYLYRMQRLTKLCKRMQVRMLIDNKQTHQDPVFIIHGTSIQVGVFLHERKVWLYVYVDQSHPFVLAHIVLQLVKLFNVEIRGTYNSKVDNSTSSVQTLSRGKGTKNENIIYH